MELLRVKFTNLKFGYFNPLMERIKVILKWITQNKKNDDLISQFYFFTSLITFPIQPLGI